VNKYFAPSRAQQLRSSLVRLSVPCPVGSRTRFVVVYYFARPHRAHATSPFNSNNRKTTAGGISLRSPTVNP